MDGILNINKEKGITSFGVVARVRKIAEQKKVGHTGTLDPLATGLLTVCLGQATRIAQYVMAQRKTYRAVVELGTNTDTYDAEGQVIYEGDYSTVTKKDVLAALKPFEGLIRQRPPLYSAIKHKGERLYRLARRRLQVEVPARNVRIYSVELLSFESPQLTLKVECGKGTYIRSLAFDLGQKLGCGAYLKELCRTANGPFLLTDAITLQQLSDAVNKGCWQKLVKPIDSALMELELLILNDEQGYRLSNGETVELDKEELCSIAVGQRCRLYNQRGDFIAIGIIQGTGRELKPLKVFTTK